MHFNNIKLENNQCLKELTNGESCSLKLRYGIIEIDDMLRDLQYWETLLTSSFMQRPHEVLIRGDQFDQVQAMQT